MEKLRGSPIGATGYGCAVRVGVPPLGATGAKPNWYGVGQVREVKVAAVVRR